MTPTKTIVMDLTAPPAAPPVPEPVDAHDFLAKQFPPRDLLLSPWLPAKGLAMIAAPRGLGKTHVAMNVGYAVASGGAFLRWRASTAHRVLYIDVRRHVKLPPRRHEELPPP